MNPRKILLGVFLAIFTGCSLAPSYERPALPTRRSLISEQYSATLNLSAWELDFWGRRVRNLSTAALESYLATAEARRAMTIQLNVDATRMSQAFTGSGYIQTIISGEISSFLQGYRANPIPPVDLALRARFNPQLNKSWFGAVMKVIDNVTMLSIILTGAGLAVVWPQFVTLVLIGSTLFGLSLARFRKTLATMA